MSSDHHTCRYSTVNNERATTNFRQRPSVHHANKRARWNSGTLQNTMMRENTRLGNCEIAGSMQLRNKKKH